jgi:crossover junction endodeoxyribonuclease RusA
MKLTLPWPSSALSPNSRSRWTKIKETVAARNLASMMLFEAGVSQAATSSPLIIRYRFYPPNKRHFDLDGLISRCKAYQDGIFEYFGMDDNLIVTLDARRCEVRKGGAVEVTIEEDTDGEMQF